MNTKTNADVSVENDVLIQTTNRIIEVFKQNGITVHDVTEVEKHGHSVRKMIIHTDRVPVQVKQYDEGYSEADRALMIFAHVASEVAMTFGDEGKDYTNEAAQKIALKIK